MGKIMKIIESKLESPGTWIVKLSCGCKTYMTTRKDCKTPPKERFCSTCWLKGNENTITCSVQSKSCECYYENPENKDSIEAQRSSYIYQDKQWRFYKGKDICYQCWKESGVDHG